jgi:hypothetical protein
MIPSELKVKYLIEAFEEMHEIVTVFAPRLRRAIQSSYSFHAPGGFGEHSCPYDFVIYASQFKLISIDGDFFTVQITAANLFCFPISLLYASDDELLLHVDEQVIATVDYIEKVEQDAEKQKRHAQFLELLKEFG